MPGLHVRMGSNGDTKTAAAAQLPHAVETFGVLGEVSLALLPYIVFPYMGAWLPTDALL